MRTTYQILTVGFSTADAERPELNYQRGVLTVRFIDWREKPVVLRFREVAGFRWQDEAPLPDGVRDDASYEVFESPWPEELITLGAAGSNDHHYKLCFNAAGVLDVVSEKFL